MATESLAQKAYDHVQESIFSGRLRAGAVISEAALAKELGISRTPVGEAVRQLVREGLVEQVPRFGTIVKSLDQRDLLELYEMREALESYAAARAAEHVQDETLDRLQHYCDVMEKIGLEMAATGARTLDEAGLRRFLAADMAFHMLIIEAAGNRRMIDAVKNMRTISRIFRMRRAWHDLGIVKKAHEFHRLILEALRGHDPEAARRHMAEHIVASKLETLSVLHPTPLASQSVVLRELPADVLKELDAIEQARQLDEAPPAALAALAEPKPRPRRGGTTTTMPARAGV